MIIIDLVYIEKSLMFRSRLAVEVWSNVMPTGLPFQMFIYSVYYLYYRQVYNEGPQIFSQYILPDLILLILMLIPFCLRFRPSERGTWYYPRGIKEHKKFAIDSRIEPNFCFRVNLRKIDLLKNYNQSHHKAMRNVPVCKRFDLKFLTSRGKRVAFKDFNLNSTQPFSPKISSDCRSPTTLSLYAV